MRKQILLSSRLPFVLKSQLFFVLFDQYFLDSIFNFRINKMKKNIQNVSVKFECQPTCVNCCQLSQGFVFLTENEAAKIAVYLNVSEDELLHYFTKVIDDKLCLVDGEENNCVFLENLKCNIYDVRPSQCQTYPFWPENMKSKFRWQLTSKECPGIGMGRTYSDDEIGQILNGKSVNSKR